MLRPYSSLLAILASVTGVLGQAPTVNTKSGPVTGFVIESKVKAFYGIPFANVPERFSPPAGPTPWTTPLNATKLKPACIQQFNYPEANRNFTQMVFSKPMPEESEDCLYLNVWAPSSTPPEGGFPVMFWIFGGNLQFGTGSLPKYNGAKMASLRDVVVVTHNYRTNGMVPRLDISKANVRLILMAVFGFPGSPEIPNGVNNLGFLDQRKALDWVSQNIALFNGNPKKLALFGESAGGYSVKQLLAIPPQPVPFHAAIMQSQASYGAPARESWNKLVAKVNCSGAASALACMRQLPAATIKDAIERGNLGFDPIADETTFTKDVGVQIRAGTAAKVPVIIGSNAAEGTAFLKVALGNSSIGDFFAKVAGPAAAPGLAALVAPLYPRAAYPTDMSVASAILTHLVFQCSAAALAAALADSGHGPVYRYFFSADFPENSPFDAAGAYHSAELEPLFKTYAPALARMDRLSDFMLGTWTRFGADPHAPLPGWPRVAASAAAPASQLVLELAVERETVIPAASIDGTCAVYSPVLKGLGL